MGAEHAPREPRGTIDDAPRDGSVARQHRPGTRHEQKRERIRAKRSTYVHSSCSLTLSLKVRDKLSDTIRLLTCRDVATLMRHVSQLLM
jgi:hypothetical protein